MSFSLFASKISRATRIFNLENLELGSEREANEDKDDDDDRKLRILYGYLSTVCPALVDLYLNLECLQGRRSSFLASRHLELRVGFILLTRLEGLERLAFHNPQAGFWNKTRTTLGVNVPKDMEIDWMVAESSAEETEKVNSERSEAWREFYASQMWEGLLQREQETDGPMREMHRQAVEYMYAVSTTASQGDKNKDQQWETRKEEADIRYREPKKCADYEEMMAKLENLGLLLDVKLVLDQVLRRRSEGTFRPWPRMRHASVFGNRACPFGRTIAQEFRTRHRPPRSSE